MAVSRSFLRKTMEKRVYLACPRPQRDGTAVRKSMQIVGKKHADCVAKALLLLRNKARIAW